MRRRYRRRPGARGRLHAPSGVRKHHATLRAAELRPASPPKPSVKKRAPPLWNRWIDEVGRSSEVSLKVLLKTHIRVSSFSKLQTYLRVCDERSNPSRHWTKPQRRRFLVVVENCTYFHRKCKTNATRTRTSEEVRSRAGPRAEYPVARLLG